jgi:hypothetical protein
VIDVLLLSIFYLPKLLPFEYTVYKNKYENMHMSQMCVTARRKAGVTARSYTTRLVTEQSYHTHEKECKFIVHDCLNDASFIFMVA